MGTEEAFERAVRQHDACIAQLGLNIWVGSEPTFTDRQAQSPPWLHTALGGDKAQRAQTLLRDLSVLQPGGLLLRSVGRRYAGEASPRWNLGLLHQRNGQTLWRGPPDPVLCPAASPANDAHAAALAVALTHALGDLVGLTQCAPAVDDEHGPMWQVTGGASPSDTDKLVFAIYLQTQALDEKPTDTQGPDTQAPDSGVAANCWLALALPAIASVARFLGVLACIEQAALASGTPALMFTGATPPVDHTLALTCITPDPAVVEVSTAPSPNCTEFLWRSELVYAAAAAQQLSPYRLYFNGQVADSGGAGQITLGGPTPQTSPFIQHAHLLPGLVRFLNHHPALSYFFSHDFVGGSGQSVRPDERGSDALDDLVLALTLLARAPALSPEMLWRSLAGFLCDAVGNSHRAEVNIEKLWNPCLPGRGCLGLVEFRALRMQHTPQRAAALACLLRAVIAMLIVQPNTAPLIDWGRTLHDRYALPFYLQQDLAAVLAELEHAGLGLGTDIGRVLQHNDFRLFGRVNLPVGTLELWRGLEFWPLVGDAASPEQSGTSRRVDASTARIEVRWMPRLNAPADSNASPNHWFDWCISVNNARLPMHRETSRQGELAVGGVRYCSFAAGAGLHPALQAQAPLTLTLTHPQVATGYVVQLHEWAPNGLAYPGLPEDLDEARQRRAGRVTVTQQPGQLPAADAGKPADNAPTPMGLSDFCLDLRYAVAPE